MLDGFLVHLADWSEIFAPGPQSASVKLLHYGEYFPKFIGTTALQILHYFCNRLGRANIDEKMDMLFHNLYCFELKFIALGNRKEYTFQLHSNVSPTKHLETFVGHEYNVILALSKAMAI